MLARLRPRRPSHTTVVAYLALFIAVGGGTAFAVVAANQVNSESIINKEVKNADLAPNSVGPGKVIDGSLTGDDLAALTIHNKNVAPETLTSAVLAANSVGSSEIKSGAVGGSELGTLPGTRVWRRTGFTVHENTTTKLPFDTATVGSGMFDPAKPTRLTIPRTGRYLVTANVTWDDLDACKTYDLGGGSGPITDCEFLRLVIGRNGFQAAPIANAEGWAPRGHDASGSLAQSATTMTALDKGDFLEVRVFESDPNEPNNKATATIRSKADYSPILAAQYLGAK